MSDDRDLYYCPYGCERFYTDAGGNEACIYCDRLREEGEATMIDTSNLTPLERELLAMLTEHVQTRGGSDDAIRLIHLIRNGYRGELRP